MTKLMMVSGIVLVMAAFASGQRLSRINFTVDRGAGLPSADSGAPDALALRYFCEIFASVPSAFSSSMALFSSGRYPLSFRAANPCSLFSPACAAILTDLSFFSAR
jgi:hypothetical protein